MEHTERHDRNPALAELLDDAFVAPVDVDTASRHLWVIHSEAAKMAEEATQEAEAEVVAEADALLATQPFRGSLARRGLPRAAVPVLALMILMSFSGVAVAASHNSLPGDALYMVKRGTERAQLIFVRDPVTRAELQLSFARTRLAEIERIADTRPQHVANLVAEIAVTLDEVDKAPPEVAEQVQPVTESIRRETTQSIAVLDLPSDYDDAVAVAMTATATPTATDSGTTPVPATGSPSATPLDNLTPVASVEPKDTDGDGIPDTPASVVPNPTAQPEPVAGEGTEGTEGSEDPDGEATEDPSADPSAEPTPTSTATPSPTPSPTPTGSETDAEDPAAAPSANPSGQPSATPSGQPSGQPSDDGSAPPPSDGPVVTPRPQPSEADDSGQSRSDDEDTVEDDGDGSQTQPGPVSRPGNTSASTSTEAETTSSEPAPERTVPVPEDQTVARPAIGRPGDVAQ